MPQRCANASTMPMRTHLIAKHRIGVLALVAVALIALGACRTVSMSLFETGRSAMRSLTGVKKSVVDTGTQQIGYLHRDGEGPPIVLLHGFASEKDVWLRFLRGVDDSVEIYAIDLPGHGDSTRDPDFRYDIPGMVGQVEAAIAALIDTPFHLVGTSLGGMVATYYAASNHERVVTLALFAPAGVYPRNPSAFQQAVARGENPLIVNEPREFDALVDIVFYDPPPLLWPVGSALRQYAIARSEFNNKIWRDLWPGHPTVDQVLPDIVAPVLLVWGREDRVLDVSSVEVFERLLPRVETVIVDAAGHAIINEKPREMAALHAQFLERTRCGGSDAACVTRAMQDPAMPVSGE